MSRRHDPHPPQQQLSRPQERWLYWVGGVLALSGVGWLVCHYGLRGPGPAPHPLEVWWLRLHGASMVGFLIMFGMLLPGHVKHGWRQGLNLGSGLPLLIATGLLILTGYGLYYIVSDAVRDWVSVVHWGLGLAAVATVGLHVVLGKQQARLRRESAERKLAVRHAARRAHSSP
jgi:hypothetical protein